MRFPRAGTGLHLSMWPHRRINGGPVISLAGINTEAFSQIKTMQEGTEMSLTSDSNDPRLGRGVDKEEVDQQEVYLVLSKEELDKGFVRPVRDKYIHDVCGVLTRMNHTIAETYARDPFFYGATYCVKCRKHLPVSEFTWDGTNEKVGS